MQHKQILVFLTLMFFILSSCRDYKDDLDIVKQFKPDDKYFKAALVTLHFIREVSAIDKVDSTYSDLISRYNLPTDAKGCPDGVFAGTSPYDAFDYRHTVTIRIKDEKIVAVDYNEVFNNGKGKRGDVFYNEEMSVSGTSPAKAYPIYEQQLLDKQNILDIDSVTGASYSNYRFRYAVMLALMKARLSAQQ